MKPIVYLAGPITGLSFAQAYTWRQIAAAALAPDIECANPFRGHADFLANETKIKHTYDGNPFCTARSIMVQDHYDVCRSTVLLSDFTGATSKSGGTFMEFGWAWDKHKPVIAVMEDSGNPHDGHPMLMEAITVRVNNLDDAIEIVRRLVLTK